MNGEVKDIGIDVKAPRPPATTSTAPSTAKLPVRGQIIDGVVISVKMNKYRRGREQLPEV